MKHDSLKKFVSLHRALIAEKTKLETRLAAVNHALSGSNKGIASPKRRKRRKMSASARAKIAAAQKARWAKVRAAKK